MKETVITKELLIKAIKAFYLGKLKAMYLGDIYFSIRLYSAASVYYQAYLNDIREQDLNEEKSYCLYRLAQCYLLQTNSKCSDWQYLHVYECLRSAINFDAHNYNAYILLGNIFKLKLKSTEDWETYKRMYYSFEYVVHNLLHLIKDDDINVVAQMIVDFYDLSEKLFICHYQSTEKYIYDFLSKHNHQINPDIYQKIINAMYLNRNKPEDEQRFIHRSF